MDESSSEQFLLTKLPPCVCVCVCACRTIPFLFSLTFHLCVVDEGCSQTSCY